MSLYQSADGNGEISITESKRGDYFSVFEVNRADTLGCFLNGSLLRDKRIKIAGYRAIDENNMVITLHAKKGPGPVSKPSYLLYNALQERIKMLEEIKRQVSNI